MAVDEIVRLVKTAVKLGVSRVKLTGGEPLSRKDIVEVVEEIAAIPGLKDLSMTTNGTMLAHVARELCAKGLKRVNISLPTLNGEVYNKLTGGRVETVLEGARAAGAAGFYPVKLNMLILKGVNDDAVPEMIDFARETGAILQLIELEPINVSDVYYSMHHKRLDEYEEMLMQKSMKVEARKYMQNRRVYHLPDVTVEIVHPVENTDFCRHCTRVRVTSEGKLKPCLMRNDNLVETLTSLRNGADEQEIEELFRIVNQKRQPFNTN
jgi:cyclic pyranopterin phosphate synthase